MNFNKNDGFTLVELMIVVAIIGILATLAIPDFMKMQAKSKQSEAKMNLGAIYVAQVAYFTEQSSYAKGANAFDLIGWQPEDIRSARYSYMLSDDLIQPPNPPPSLPAPIDIDNYSFTAIAAGNIDNDNSIDVWYINDAKRLLHISSDLAD